MGEGHAFGNGNDALGNDAIGNDSTRLFNIIGWQKKRQALRFINGSDSYLFHSIVIGDGNHGDYVIIGASYHNAMTRY